MFCFMFCGSPWGIVFLWLSCSELALAQPSAWPQFRGPTGQGVVRDISLPTAWSEKENVAWKTRIPGLGHSSPVHDGQTVWLTTATVDGRKLQAVSVDLTTGTLQKEITIFEPDEIEEIHQDNSYASPTPVLKNGRMYAHFGTYGTACLDCTSGEILWKNNDFPVEHQGGPGSSPVVFEDLLILTLDGAQKQRVVALDLADGSVRWERKRSASFRANPITHRAFSTPLLHEFDGQTLLISPGADQCHAYDARTGEEVWHVTYTGFSNVPSPVAVGDVTIFCTGFFKPELCAVHLGGIGNVSTTQKAWDFRGTVPDVPSPILVGEQVVIVSDDGIVTSVDLESGERNWGLRIGGNVSASPIYANKLLYFCTEEGLTKIVDPHAERPKLVRVNRLDGQIMASPAVVEEDLLIRTTTSLYRIQH